MRRGASVAVALGAALGSCLAAPGCSGGSSAPDASPTGEPTCTAPLAEVGRSCPATFDGTLASVACPTFGGEQHVFACGDTIVLYERDNFTDEWCVYDSAAQALVGAKATTDTTEYCAGRSYAEVAGQAADAACVAGTPAAARVCPRAGADAGPEAGAPDAGADVSVSE
jgi:hypothetical protein